MSPEMRLRISAQNDTARGFAEVKRDAATAASAIEASSGRAGAAFARTSAMAINNSRQLSYQLIDMGQAIPLAFQSPIHGLQNMGFQIAQIGQLYMGQGGMKQALVDAVGQVGRFAVKLGPLALAAGVVTAGFAGLTYEINKTAETQVSFGSVFMASLQLIGESIGTLVAPAIAQIGTWTKQMWDYAWPIWKDNINGIIGAMVGAYEATKQAWSNLPTFFGAVGKEAWNNLVSEFEKPALTWNDQVIIPGFDLSGMKAQLSEAEKAAMGAASISFEGSQRDYVGDALGAVSGRAQELELTKLAEDIEKTGEAAKAANDNIDPFAARMKELSDVLTETHDPFTQMQNDLTDLQTLWEHNRISAEQYHSAVSRVALGTASETLGMVGQLTGAFSQLFEDNKGLAVANAVVNTAEGITKALAQGGIFGFVGAAAVAASGAAQIATILSAKPGGGTRPSVSGAGGSGGAAAQQAEAQKVMHVTFQGKTRWGAEDFREFAEGYNDFVGDGGTRIVVNAA